MNNAVEVKDLCKKYKDFKLDNVSFNIESGTIMGFVGKNGAGKTTTIKEILNIISRDSGSVKIFGLDNIADEIQIKEDIGVVFDDICFHKSLNLRNINSIMGGIYKNWSKETFFRLIKEFELPERKHFKVYSRGMKMKASIAVALSHNARLLILDEPTSGLDPIARSEILDILQDFIVSEDHTVLFSSHITSDLERIADTITFIDNGKIVFSEDKLALQDNYGILKCSPDEMDSIDKSGFISTRKTSFGLETLVNNRNEYASAHPEIVLDRASIEDIMVFYEREGKK